MPITAEDASIAVGLGFFGPVLLYFVGLLFRAARNAAEF